MSQWQMQWAVTLAGALVFWAASTSGPNLGFAAHPMPKLPMAPQVTGLVVDAYTTSLAGAPLSLAASSSASRRRRQLLDLTLAPQQA